jgi:hypothetical protein
VTQNTPPKTKAVPVKIHKLKVSFNQKAPMVNVDIGPIMPICEVRPGPILSMAIITIKTGKTVQAVAFNMESHTTSGATFNADMGLINTNWRMQKKHATVVAKPAKRKDPKRCTS